MSKAVILQHVAHASPGPAAAGRNPTLMPVPSKDLVSILPQLIVSGSVCGAEPVEHRGVGTRRKGDLECSIPRHDGERLAKLTGEQVGDLEGRLDEVTTGGTFHFLGRLLYLAKAMVGQPISLEETDDGIWATYSSTVLLATFDRMGLHHPRPTKSVTHPPRNVVTHHPCCSGSGDRPWIASELMR